jgi:mannose-6-phosphate isomerase-like protein (cupin superfamily)
MWVEDTTPADNTDAGDKGDRQTGVAPPVGGSVFRVVEFKPVGAAGPQASNEAMKAELGLAAGDAPARHPFMHRTASVDYAVILSGEIDMLLDDGEVRLKAGDVVVQRGTNHAWVNRSGAPCRIAFVLIDAKNP